MNPPISAAKILQLFDVDLENGRLIWKNPPSYHPRLKGKQAGTKRASRRGKFYWVIHVDKKAYVRGKLIYAVATGGWAEVLDHINGDSLDDRALNVRAATISQNVWNRSKGQSRSGLPMGVRTTRQGRFQARITSEKKHFALGTFETVALARAAYLEARRTFFGAFAGVDAL
jgi:hypothetical protein